MGSGGVLSFMSMVAFHCFHSKFPRQPAQVSNPTAPPAWSHHCTHLSIVSLRVFLNNSPPPHTQIILLPCLISDGSTYGSSGLLRKSMECLWSKWLQPPAVLCLFCHCSSSLISVTVLPLCCRSIPFEGLTGVNTVPASCGD